MPSGKHTVTWKFCNDDEDFETRCTIKDIGVEKTPTITVSLKEAGSLGTEVLYSTDNVANVRKLIVSGPMNDDDWTRIMMMTSLFSLDLTDAVVTEIPDEQFGSKLPFFHEIKLPATLKRIGESAFEGTLLDNISLPEGIATLGARAFYRTRIRELNLPASLTTLEILKGYSNNSSYTFANNQSLEKVTFPASAVSIPGSCFEGCNVLKPFVIPEGITTIGYSAFKDCYSFDSEIPSTVKSIGDNAFDNSGITNVNITENTTVGDYAFQNCNRLKTVVLPTTFYEENYRLLNNCDSLTDVTFKSPTLVTAKRKNMFEGTTMSNVRLHVPSYLYNAYKTDPYWYNCDVQSFSTADIKEWTINTALKLGENDRLEGTPDVIVNTGGSITVSGETAMPLNDMTINLDGYNNKYYYRNGFVYSQLLMNTENTTVEGKLSYKVVTNEKTWYFLSMPFDFKVGDLTNANGASYAIRYYDGVTRAENGTSGNWKNYSGNDTIKAGTGFIYQTSQTTTTTFTALDNEAKQYALSNKIFTKALLANNSDNTSDKGWNLVGNPWVSYYNIHKLNFVAPITVWDMNNRNYTAYSVIDDDYAIKPNEAFFVQCPDEVANISFPIDGRQLTTEIKEQNGAKPAIGNVRSRRLIDIEIANEDAKDKTRLVVNDNASMGYETSCDASKFTSMDATVPQLYTLGTDGTRYAINERPEGNNTVELGMTIQKAGTYTFHALRNDLGSVTLTDADTDTQTDLSMADYTFTSDAGTFNDRFVLSFGNAVTGINAVGQPEGVSVTSADGSISVKGKATIYSADGRKIAEVSGGSVKVAGGVYIVRTANETVKVNVK